MKAESVPGILITVWVVSITVLIVIRRKEIGDRKLGWLSSMWIFPAFAVADLVRTSVGGTSPTARHVLATISFLVSSLVWLALVQSIGFAVMSKQRIIAEYALMFAPAFTAFVVWKLAKRLKREDQSHCSSPER